MKSKKLQELANKRKPEVKRFIDLSDGVAEELEQIRERNGWSQKELAEAIGKSRSDVSVYLSGQHNFTLKSVAYLESKLGERLLYTLSDVKKREISKNRIDMETLEFMIESSIMKHFAVDNSKDVKISMSGFQSKNFHISNSGYGLSDIVDCEMMN